MDLICLGCPGIVPVLWDLKITFPVSRKVQFGSQLSRGFPSRNNNKILTMPTNISILPLWEKHL